jgi:RNA recognition motif-containing protein
MKRLYVGNLLYSATYDEVRDLFGEYGTVYDVELIAEREPGHPHAFAFVEMEDAEADTAIDALDASDYMGLTLRVEEANGYAGPVTPRDNLSV